MSRRTGAGVVDRHALLSTSAYPSSSRSSPSPYRNASPFEQPYAENTSDPYSEYNVGAPKKEAPLYGSGMNGGNSSGSGLWGARSAEQLEEQNDDKLEGLSAKVRILKDITVGIGNEVRDSTKDLDSLVSTKFAIDDSSV
jgi:blocked-early-in-transport protein 1